MGSESTILGSSMRNFSSRPPGRRTGERVARPADLSLAEHARKALGDAGLLVVNATGLETETKDFVAEIDGDFGEFARVAKELGARVVFFEATTFDDIDFEGPNDDEESVDVREIEPSLRDFDRYLGSCHLVRAVACFSGGIIVKHDSPDWLSEFYEPRDSTLAGAAEAANEQRDERERAYQEQQDSAVRKVRSLAQDDQFREFMLCQWDLRCGSESNYDMHGWGLAARASPCAIQRRLIRYNPTFVG
jgi:hypothetical protein